VSPSRGRVGLALAAARAHAQALAFAITVMPMLPSRPIDWLTRAPTRETVEYQTAAGLVTAELHRPPGRGPHPAVLVCLGVVPIGIDHPQVARIKDALARSGFVALIHWSPAMRDLRLVPEDEADIAAAYAYLLTRRDVDPSRSGLMGTCVGGSFALLAAADPAIRDRVAFVAAFAPYSSLWTFLRDVASRTRSDDGRVERWAVDPLTRQVFVRSVTDCLPAYEADALREGEARSSTVDPSTLSVEGRAVRRLLTAADRNAAEVALRKLPRTLRERLDAMSPLQSIERVTAPLILFGHDRDDVVIPVGESRRLARALATRAGVTYTEYGMFQHADPTRRKLSPLRLARELRRFYLSLYPMFRQAAG
jgi:dienelactone hydrolase